MDRPAELIRRAALKRKKMPVREEEAPLQSPPELPPRPVSRHASYTALMRSHDRMATRHIPRQG